MKTFFRIFFIIFLLASSFSGMAEDGYRLWLRYDKISDPAVLQYYRNTITSFSIQGDSPTLKAAEGELKKALNGLLGTTIPAAEKIKNDGIIIAGTAKNSKLIQSLKLENKLKDLNDEGYLISPLKIKGKKVIVIAANTDAGVLYGVFHFIKLIQTHQNLDEISISTSPKTERRLLNHWDNLDGSIERGYAGKSLWEWDSLPEIVSERYTDYARANASIGINGVVLTNVNADARILKPEYLEKVAAIADILRPWNIRVYLTARFSAPIEIGSLKRSDPLDAEVQNWWKSKTSQIYSLIPDFGGFLVKANSEGQPGPQNYGRTHSDGANLLADALAPHNGIVMWRAFVYDQNVPDDRTKQAYNEFINLDGKFRDNVIIQVKNGPLDFQPREPFHPLFGALKNSNIMAEFQITQEYLGFAKHLVFLAPLYEECLKSDTYTNGNGSLVANVVDGSLQKQKHTAMAGVANTGNSVNWTGHPFAQANWFSYGRLAWDPYLNSKDIADEWIKMTFTCEPNAVNTISTIMLASREIAVNYMTPIGLHHIMSYDLHYGPGPWVDKGRQDWTSVYYHKADSNGIGFNRSITGSNATGQYSKELQDLYNNLSTCPENLLLWFHHVSWDYTLKTNRNVWEELCFRYYSGVDSVKWMQNQWNSVKVYIDTERFDLVQTLLEEQKVNAEVWRDGCLLYFQTFSNMPIPEQYPKPAHLLEYYKNLIYTFDTVKK